MWGIQSAGCPCPHHLFSGIRRHKFPSIPTASNESTVPALASRTKAERAWNTQFGLFVRFAQLGIRTSLLHFRSGLTALRNLPNQARASGSLLQALALNPMIWEDFEGLWTLGESPGWVRVSSPLDCLFCYR